MSPFSVFHEKAKDGDSWSMTRVVAFLFAVSVCYSIFVYASKGAALGWPFVALGIVTLMAVPIQMMFRAFTAWAQTREGAAMVRKAGFALAEKFAPNLASTVESIVSATSTTTTTPTPPSTAS